MWKSLLLEFNGVHISDCTAKDAIFLDEVNDVFLFHLEDPQNQFGSVISCLPRKKLMCDFWPQWIPKKHSTDTISGKLHVIRCQYEASLMCDDLQRFCVGEMKDMLGTQSKTIDIHHVWKCMSQLVYTDGMQLLHFLSSFVHMLNILFSLLTCIISWTHALLVLFISICTC